MKSSPPKTEPPPATRLRKAVSGGFLKHIMKLAAALVALAWLSQAAAAEKIFRAGAHIVDISPTSFPVVVNAMFTERSATNVADRLHALALALDDGATRIVLCVVDTCMMSRDLIDRTKVLATQQTGLPTERMLVSATHTHSAPSAMGCLGSHTPSLPGSDARPGRVRRAGGGSKCLAVAAQMNLLS